MGLFNQKKPLLVFAPGINPCSPAQGIRPTCSWTIFVHTAPRFPDKWTGAFPGIEHTQTETRHPRIIGQHKIRKFFQDIIGGYAQTDMETVDVIGGQDEMKFTAAGIETSHLRMAAERKGFSGRNPGMVIQESIGSIGYGHKKNSPPEV